MHDLHFSNYDALVVSLFSAAAAASLVSCFWVLRGLHSLGQQSRERLFLRQVRHLAIADVLLVTSLICLRLVDYVQVKPISFIPGPTSGRLLCNGCLLGLRTGRQASACVEVHIALGFAMAAFRSKDSLKALGRFLPLIWPLTAVFDVVGVRFPASSLSYLDELRLGCCFFS